MNKVYLTVKQLPKYKQITFEDMLAGMTDGKSYILWNKLVRLPEELMLQTNLGRSEIFLWWNCAWNIFATTSSGWLKVICILTTTLSIFLRSPGTQKNLRSRQRTSQALRDLKSLFEEFMPATYHTSAYAYIENRSTIDERGPHQRHESQWYSYFDFHDFFGSTTSKFVMDMLKATYPSILSLKMAMKIFLELH